MNNIELLQKLIKKSDNIVFFETPTHYDDKAEFVINDKLGNVISKLKQWN